MASIINIVRRTSPDFTSRGNEQPSYQATWIVEVNDHIPGGQVLFLAQNASGINAVPQNGETLQWISGTSGTYVDSGAFALDFTVKLTAAPEDFPHLWTITVGWRAPRPGMDEEPGFAGVPPLARPPEYSINYYTTNEEITEAFNIIGIGQSRVTRDPFTFGALTTAAGEKVDGFYKDRSKAVFVSQQNVLNPGVALDLNNRFEDTVNNSTWNTPFQNVERHHARFLRAETGDEIHEGAFAFWRMRISVEVGSEPFYVNVPNRGIKVWDVPSDSVISNRDTDGVVQETNLNQDGSAFESNTPITIPYIAHKETGYGRLPF